MKKCLFILLACFLGANSLHAQHYNNEWIDYSKTYYKFKVGATGLYRIYGSALPAAISSTSADQFQLWRNGQQVAVYTTVPSGALSSSDYIEFWGLQNDGKPDSALYTVPANQLDNTYSLETDTAAYYLTINPSGGNARITNGTNNVAGNTLPLQPYFMYDYRYDFKTQINWGYAVNYTENLYSSTYDAGEWWSSYEIQAIGGPVTNTSGQLYVATNSGVSATLQFSGANNSYQNTTTISGTINGNTVITNANLPPFGAQIFSATGIPLNDLSGGTASFAFNDNANGLSSRLVVGFIDLQYPRQFVFDGSSNFTFTLPASAQGNYFQVSNFASASTPILYDLTNNQRFTANTSTPNVYTFALPPSALNRTLVLVSEDNANIYSVTSFTQPTFINYAASNQGNYLIISNKILGIAPNQTIDSFRQYRSSIAGGGYNAQVYDIDQLVDEFAYGIKKHPLSIKNFVTYAVNKFATRPQAVFLIGKAVEYDQYRYNESSPYADLLNLVPSFGAPFCSDALLASTSFNPIPAMLFGRLSVVSSHEASIYLAKLKQYEAAQQDTAASSQTTENKLWMKNIAHIIGVDDENENNSISPYMATYANTIMGPSFGGEVYTFNKYTSSQGNQGTSTFLQQLFSEGLGLINYFGHGSPSTLDFDLNNPTDFSNPGKYPVFFVNGCNAGNVYTYDTTRFTTLSNLSENYLLEPNNGGIAFIAGTNFGVSTYLNTYITGFYNSLSTNGYNKPVGNNMIAGTTALVQNSTDVSAFIEAQQYVINGDPALKINASSRPDFDVEQSGIFTSPSFISVNNANFTVKVYVYNIGQAVNDSVNVTLKWQLPNGTTQTLLSEKVLFYYEDSVTLIVPINGSLDAGTNEIIASIDLPNVVNETTLLNNTATEQFVIYTDDITPVYPYDFAIISKNMDTLYASTSNPLQPSEQYVMQLDTTTFFNSPAFVTKTVTSTGGVIGFVPGIVYQDSVVYYWRVAPVPSSGPYHWNNSSFVYLGGTIDGFNQSHLYQHLQSTGQNIYIDSFSRLWNFSPVTSTLILTNTVYGPNPPQDYDASFSVQLNNNYKTESACLGKSIIFNVFDPNSLQLLYNQSVPSVIPNGTSPGFMGSYNVACDHTGTVYNFEFSYDNVTSRNNMAAFMNWIPAGDIVTARVIIAAPYDDGQTFATDWQKDPLVNGTNLYLSLVNAGFSDLSSYTFPRAWVFTYQKNTPAYHPQDLFTAGTSDVVSLSKNISSPDSTGTITSPVFGPAASWKSVQWNGYSLDATPGDVATVDVLGINAAGQQTLLYNLSTAQQNFDISSVSAITYPNIQLRMHNSDSIHFTPYQLRWWRLYYTPVPEGALAPNLGYTFQDTLAVGQPFTPAFAFKNVSDVPFADSINVNITVYNKNNVATVIPIGPLKKIMPGDTAMVRANIGTQSLGGLDNFYIDVNPLTPPAPQFHQPEEYHFNNFFYHNFFVNNTSYNPSLDVTFDGVHILNNDIVSAKPSIEVKLKSQSQYLLLTDTADITLVLQYPDGTTHRFQYGTDSLRFIPAPGGGPQNIATAILTPTLSEDGNYELYVTGRDSSGNPAGFTQYAVQFQVINKAMITNVFNYPNPFTTSTAFVFTITGSQVPQNIRIEILTITGKIVKELTEADLGPLHIGRNITQGKWNGTDMYGGKLANGVYLYRVLTNLNNQSLSEFPTYDPYGNAVNTDQYFTKGYGKMYLMR